MPLNQTPRCPNIQKKATRYFFGSSSEGNAGEAVSCRVSMSSKSEANMAPQHRRDSSGEDAVHYRALISLLHFDKPSRYCDASSVYRQTYQNSGVTTTNRQEPTNLCSSPFIKLILKRHILGTSTTVVVRKAPASNLHVFAHVDAPGVVGVAR